jgi:hypothetical protein
MFPEYVPVGTAKTLCIDPTWSPLSMAKIVDRFRKIQGLPTCENSENPKFRWNPEDPTHGVDINVWTQ